MSLESTDLARFFDPYLFSASDVPNGKPAPDLFLHAADKMSVQPADCIVVEDLPAGVTAAMPPAWPRSASSAAATPAQVSANSLLPPAPALSLPTCGSSSLR